MTKLRPMTPEEAAERRAGPLADGTAPALIGFGQDYLILVHDRDIDVYFNKDRQAFKWPDFDLIATFTATDIWIDSGDLKVFLKFAVETVEALDALGAGDYFRMPHNGWQIL